MSDSSLQDKQVKAHAIVGTAVAVAAATGGIPLPIVDMIPLIGEQVAMLGGITAVFGFDLKKRALTSLVYTALSVSGATFVGKTLVSSVLKAIPFVGAWAGITVSAATAGTLTLIIGEAYIKLMSSIVESGEELPPLDELEKRLKSQIDKERRAREAAEIPSEPNPEPVQPESEPKPEPQPAPPEAEPEPETPPSEESAPPFPIRFE